MSGQFSGKAFKEAQKLGYDVVCAATTKDANFSYVPTVTRDMIRPDAAYVHMCFNNTIYGTKYGYIPDTGSIPLVADMSSCILSEPVDVSRFGVIYAGAQKNMAPAGVTVVIVREDLLDFAEPAMPTMLEWKTMADNDSMYNTPPCYTIYMLGLVADWLLSIGGLDEMKARNEKKAALLYGYLDGQDYYIAPVRKDSRSMMNVTFVTGNADLDKKFAAEASAAGLPFDKPRYVMGVGTPPQLLKMIALGADMFDCVMPTRLARHAVAFTPDGPINLKNAKFAEDDSPLDSETGGYSSKFSRAYIRHLVKANEMLACTLISMHNIRFFQNLMQKAREAIECGSYEQWSAETIARYEFPENDK